QRAGPSVSAHSPSAQTLWRRIFDGGRGLLCVTALDRATAGMRQEFYPYPRCVGNAEAWLQRQVRAGRDVYFCAHLLTDPGPKERARRKEFAAPLHAAYVDGDGASVPPHLPAPTITVQSSPGRHHYYWALNRPVEPQEGEELNRRLAYAMGADRSGWDLTQLLRPPGFANRKYQGAPIVEVLDDTGPVHDPDELLAALPPAPPRPAAATSSIGIDEDEPPVALTGRALEIHQGQHAPLKDDGTV